MGSKGIALSFTLSLWLMLINFGIDGCSFNILSCQLSPFVFVNAVFEISENFPLQYISPGFFACFPPIHHGKFMRQLRNGDDGGLDSSRGVISTGLKWALYKPLDKLLFYIILRMRESYTTFDSFTARTIAYVTDLHTVRFPDFCKKSYFSFVIPWLMAKKGVI